MFLFKNHIATRPTRIFKALTTCALCALALPAMLHAQDDELARIRFGVTVKYADLLEATHQEIIREMQSWDATSGGPETLEYLSSNEIIPYDKFRRLKHFKPTEWGVRARLCDNYLVVYYESNQFKMGIKSSEIRMAQKMRHDRLGQIDLAANKRPLGLIGDSTLTTQHGVTLPIPACMDSNYATALPRNRVAMMGGAIAVGLQASIRNLKEYRMSACVAPHVGSGKREMRHKYLPFDGRGLPIEEYVTYSDWTVSYDNCREPRTRYIVGPTRSCTRTIAGTQQNGYVKYKWLLKEIADPNDLFKTIQVVVDLDGTITESPTAEVVLSLCDTVPGPEKVTTSQTSTPELRESICSDVYPIPRNTPGIPYNQGNYIEERFFNKLVQTYNWDRDTLNIESYTDWKLKEDTCSRLLYDHAVTNTKTEDCTIAGDLGSTEHTQEVEYFKKDYAKYDFEQSYETSEQFARTWDWKLAANTCHYTTTTRVAGWAPGCGRDGNGTVTPPYTITTTTIWRDGRASTAVVTRTAAVRNCGGNPWVSDAGSGNGGSGASGGEGAGGAGEGEGGADGKG